MIQDTHPVIAREGWPHILIVITAAALLHYAAGLLAAFPLWLLAIFVLQFFRDPRRPIAGSDAHTVVCPADGRVIDVGDVQDPYLNRPAKRVCIFMNVFNVHSNRMPVAGEVKKKWYYPGKFFNASLEKSSLANERNALWLQTEHGVDVVVVQIAGLVARRILCYVQPGSRVGRGQRYGFIRFGSRVEVYLPPNAQLRVALGDRVKSGTDVIAELMR
jgi:phosphatidylserine decarboxylase